MRPMQKLIFVTVYLFLASILFTSCTANWWDKSKNISLLFWTASLPAGVSCLSALLYYQILQSKRPISFLAKESSWLVWYIVTVIISATVFLFIGIGFVFKNPRFTDWFRNYPELLVVGIISSFMCFLLFSSRVMPWRKSSAVVSIPTYKKVIKNPH
jgi:hypothetical protein